MRDHSKNHPMTATYIGSDTVTGCSYTTLLDSTVAGSELVNALTELALDGTSIADPESSPNVFAPPTCQRWCKLSERTQTPHRSCSTRR